ncbi:MAG: hypothetical protein PW843_03055 [Azospirillaceae bacterium]|nr:hypothetical protein [Azospirillaceae bacterium]
MLVVLALLLPLPTGPVWARQDAWTPDADSTPVVDPPARVGRLARVQGTVSFRADGANEGDWTVVPPNYPLTGGNDLWVEAGSGAVVEVSITRVALDGGTELDITTLDDHALVADLVQGQIYVRVRGLLPDESYTFRTPRGDVTLDAPGRYQLSAGDGQASTRVTVLEGLAWINGDGLSLRLQGGQTGEISGDDPPNISVLPVQRDAFLTGALAADRVGSSTPPDLLGMPGADDLASYGVWQVTPDYGQVWYPQVAPDWAPYRQGSWVDVAPWGRTWIDSAPWGFAPFHYGRWVDIRGRWAWAPRGGNVVPGAPFRPVYAPALVAFFGAGPSVGWCPLGWQEPYRPWYRTSRFYVDYVNRPAVRGFTRGVGDRSLDSYADWRGASMMAADGRRGVRPFDDRQFGGPARAMAGGPPPSFGQGVSPAATHPPHRPKPRPLSRPDVSSAGRPLPMMNGPTERPAPVWRGDRRPDAARAQAPMQHGPPDARPGPPRPPDHHPPSGPPAQQARPMPHPTAPQAQARPVPVQPSHPEPARPAPGRNDSPALPRR